MPIDVVETIEALVEQVASKAAEKGIELARRINPAVPAAMIGEPKARDEESVIKRSFEE